MFKKQYNYIATVRMLDMKTQVKATDTRTLARLLGITTMTLRKLIHNPNHSTYRNKISITRTPYVKQSA
jgi:hypothetical protein